MHPAMILRLFRKDLLDAIRDARVLVAILLPLAAGLVYNAIFDDTPPTPSTTVAYYAAGPSGVPEALRAAGGDAIDIELRAAGSAEEVRRLVAEEEAGAGLILPAGFDEAVRRGEAPALAVVLPESPGLGAAFVSRALEPILRQLAGQRPPAAIQPETVATAAADASVFERVGLRRYFVLTTLVFLIAMISMVAVPIILTEEGEKKTLDALVLVASYADVIAAKALVGLLYIAVASALLLAITGIAPAAYLPFVGGLALLGVTLVGFGLLMGGLFRNANQVNTWGGVLLLPITLPVFLVGFPVPAIAGTILALLPTSQATRLALNGLSGAAIFPHPWLSALVIAVWGAAAYALLTWRLSRREA